MNMISSVQSQQLINGVWVRTTTYYGLSTDTKPTDGVGNGSAFLEMDTGKIYFYDVENTTWREWGA